jgi:hypothetical protein
LLKGKRQLATSNWQQPGNGQRLATGNWEQLANGNGDGALQTNSLCSTYTLKFLDNI